MCAPADFAAVPDPYWTQLLAQPDRPPIVVAYGMGFTTTRFTGIAETLLLLSHTPIDETRAHVQLVLELYWALLQDRQSRRATGMQMQPAR